MKFQVNTRLLNEALSLIAPTIDNNPIVSILENFHAEIENSYLILTASNQGMCMTTRIPISNNADDRGEICLPSRLLHDTIRSVQTEVIDVDIEMDSKVVEIYAGEARFQMRGVGGQDFNDHMIVLNRGTIEIDMEKESLDNAIGRTLPFTSNDDLRPAMTGIYIHQKDGLLTFVATDAHRLAIHQTDLPSDLVNMIVPKRTMQILKGAIRSIPTPQVKIIANETHISFKMERLILTAKLVVESYPNYQGVIPKEKNIQISVSQYELVQSLKRISLYTDKGTQQVRLEVQQDTLKIVGTDMDLGNDATETLKLRRHVGPDIVIGFNAKYLLEACQLMPSEELVFSMIQPNRACLISTSEMSDYLILMMPVLVHEYAESVSE